jgi:glycerophosphoryl diester phosphodiesterase
VLAHRGASRAAAENTPEAFRLALRLGADGVELDTRRSARGELVVFHDPEIAGTPVRRLAAPPVAGLAAALDASAGGIVNVELKTDGDVAGGVAAALCAFLRRRGARDRVLASSFDPLALRMVRALRPDIPTALVVGPDGDIDLALYEAMALRHRALHPQHAIVDGALVRRARALGLAIHAWTVNEVDELDRLARLGVDGLITDVPDVALGVLGSSARGLAPASPAA